MLQGVVVSDTKIKTANEDWERMMAQFGILTVEKVDSSEKVEAFFEEFDLFLKKLLPWKGQMRRVLVSKISDDLMALSQWQVADKKMIIGFIDKEGRLLDNMGKPGKYKSNWYDFKARKAERHERRDLRYRTVGGVIRELAERHRSHPILYIVQISRFVLKTEHKFKGDFFRSPGTEVHYFDNDIQLKLTVYKSPKDSTITEWLLDDRSRAEAIRMAAREEIQNEISQAEERKGTIY